MSSELTESEWNVDLLYSLIILSELFSLLSINMFFSQSFLTKEGLADYSVQQSVI